MTSVRLNKTSRNSFVNNVMDAWDKTNVLKVKEPVSLQTEYQAVIAQMVLTECRKLKKTLGNAYSTSLLKRNFRIYYLNVNGDSEYLTLNKTAYPEFEEVAINSDGWNFYVPTLWGHKPVVNLQKDCTEEIKTILKKIPKYRRAHRAWSIATKEHALKRKNYKTQIRKLIEDVSSSKQLGDVWKEGLEYLDPYTKPASTALAINIQDLNNQLK